MLLKSLELELRDEWSMTTPVGRIQEITAICRDIPLRRPFRFASHELNTLPYAWVRAETSEGLVGYGECPTYWDPSGETQLAAVGAVRHLAPSLKGMDAGDLEQIFAT